MRRIISRNEHLVLPSALGFGSAVATRRSSSSVPSRRIVSRFAGVQLAIVTAKNGSASPSVAPLGHAVVAVSTCLHLILNLGVFREPARA